MFDLQLKPRYRRWTAWFRDALLRPRQTDPGLWKGLSGQSRRATHFRGPVNWLLGRDLLTQMRSIALYSAFGDELDHRDWMTNPGLLPLTTEADEDELWFDYLSDSGDGQLAAYDVAYLCLGDLFSAGDTPGAAVTVRSDERHPTALRRGRFLLIGGDTAYHVADHPTLRERMAAPFRWAHDDLAAAGRAGVADGQRRLLFGIPGNHDYYDSLAGFNRQFRAPGDPHLTLADFQRAQETSYVALDLPFGWQLWALDAQEGKLDWRQRRFFRDIAERKPSDKLIVATPEPRMVFGAPNAPATKRGNPWRDLQLEGKVKVAIGGDVHHYARYSTVGADGTTPVHDVVAGGGGAFLHPSHTRLGPATPTEQYPSDAVSKHQTTRRLLCPWYILTGGYLWLVGALCAAVLYLGAAVSESSSRPLHSMLSAILAPIEPLLTREAPAVPLPVPTDQAAGLAQDSLLQEMQNVLRPVSRSHPTGADLLAALILIVVVALVAGISVRLFARARERPRPGDAPGALMVGRYARLLLLIAPGLVAWKLALQAELGGSFSSFCANGLVILYALVLIGSVVWSYAYTSTLPKQAKSRRVGPQDYLPVWVVLGLGVAIAVFGVRRYGGEPVRVFAADAGVMAVMALLLGLVAMGAVSGGGRHRWRRKLLLGGLGLWLGLTLAFVPLVVSVYASPRRAVMVIGLGVLLNLAAFFLLARKANRWALLIAWVLVSLTEVALAVSSISPQPVSLPRMLLLAPFVGATFTCLSFGWYLATALAWDGHNNEAGGAARIEGYKHFVRFRLTAQGLTGFVIGFDRPTDRPESLAARLVDVFRA